jgi:hypothetical protein
MAHKPITNDTLMVDMIETPGNKNSQDQILIQDNSAVRTYKEDISVLVVRQINPSNVLFERL